MATWSRVVNMGMVKDSLTHLGVFYTENDFSKLMKNSQINFYQNIK